MTNPITFTIEEDDEEIEYSLPTRYEVCNECRGEGKHVGRAVESDGGGFTSSEWQEACHDDPDFAEDYFGGIYDVVCECCHGARVVPVVDEDSLTLEQMDVLKKYEEYQREQYDYEASCAAERRMGY